MKGHKEPYFIHPLMNMSSCDSEMLTADYAHESIRLSSAVPDFLMSFPINSLSH